MFSIFFSHEQLPPVPVAPGFAQVLPRRRGALRRCRGPGADGGYAAADGADHHAGAVEEL